MVIKQKHLIEFQIYYLMIVEALIQLLHFPEVIRYVLDVNAIFLVFIALPKVKNMLNDKVFKKYIIYLFLFMGITIAVSIIRRTPFGQVVWAARNNYIYIFFMLVCSYTIREKDYNRIMNNVVSLQVFNFLCVLYEYFILNKMGDFAGGMFGVEHGCNGFLNVYLVVINAYVFTAYANKRSSLLRVAWIALSSVGIAAISELKFFFIELAVIVVHSLSLSRLSVKSTLMVISAIVAIFIGLEILSVVSPWSVEVLQDFDQTTHYATNSYNSTLITRGTPFSDVNKHFFGDNIFYKLFGYGFGACEDSETFSWANSNFATAYRSMRYRNLTTSDRYLETGYIGFIALILVFALLFYIAQKQKKENPNIRYAYAFSQTVSVLVIINFWYNCTIRTNIAYLTFFALSAALVCTRELKLKEAELIAKTQPKKKTYFKQTSGR